MTRVGAFLLGMFLAWSAFASPRINAPSVVGTRTGAPFFFRIPAVGSGALHYEAWHLPTGLRLDSEQGILSGQVGEKGEFNVDLAVSDLTGTTRSKLRIISGEGALGQTPAMGWNSWNVWGCAVDQAKIRAAADALVATGLAAHGYQYVNIDDCWEGKRKSDGEIQTNARFPDMKALADYVHGLGLRLGIYSSPGPKTCQGYEGSQGHEFQDAATYARWGIDYLKYDWCSYRGDYRKPYQIMGEALKAAGRGIYYSLCQYGMGNVWEWGASVGANSWRTTGDLVDNWQAVVKIGFGQNGLSDYSGPGHWNDPDMLVVGELGWGSDHHPTRLTPDEQRTHLTLWSMLAAPLLIGADLSRLDKFTYGLLTNDEVIAIDQDPQGQQASRVAGDSAHQAWVRPLDDGARAIALFNLSDREDEVRYSWSELGLSGVYSIRDLWRHVDLSTRIDGVEARIPAHGAALFRAVHTGANEFFPHP